MKNTVRLYGATQLMLVLLTFFCAISTSLNAQEAPKRTWTDQQGRKIDAALVNVSGNRAVLRLENGTYSTIGIEILSPADQQYILAMQRQISGLNKGPMQVPKSSLVWPVNITVDSKSLNVEEGIKNEDERIYEYRSGSFSFVAKAPLTGTVMTEIAADFELMQATLAQLPWGWQPKPRDGTRFKVLLTETIEDYIAAGGKDNTYGGSTDDYAYLKFSSLGLKKVGSRYAYDSRQKNEGRVVGLTTRLLVWDMRRLLVPWTARGIEEFLNDVAYRNGSIRFTNLESSIKDMIKKYEPGGIETNLPRMVALLKRTWAENDSGVSKLLLEYQMDSALLFYYFGFLDGEGKGTRLHEYFRTVSQECLMWRAYYETRGRAPTPGGRSSQEIPMRAQELVTQLIGDRTEEQLAQDIDTKFRAFGVKLGK